MSLRKPVVLLAFFGLIVLAACSKEAAPPSAQPAGGTPAATATPVDQATAATITGTVKFQDGKPKRATIRMDADATCASLHKEPVLAEDALVNDNGTLRNAFVYVSQGLGGRTFAPPGQAVELDQKGCQYTPHVVALMTNQEIRIKNGDQTTHNIHPSPKNNREWNRSQPPGAEDIVEKFAREELLIPVKCNIHPWMRSYIAVLNHPFFSITGTDGSFEIKGLPPGEYTITAWHEKYGTVEQKITVGPKEKKSITFTFKPAGAGD